MSNDVKLEPCLFCGGEAQVHSPPFDYTSTYVMCGNCCAKRRSLQQFSDESNFSVTQEYRQRKGKQAQALSDRFAAILSRLRGEGE